jgi:hypothetical protein
MWRMAELLLVVHLSQADVVRLRAGGGYHCSPDPVAGILKARQLDSSELFVSIACYPGIVPATTGAHGYGSCRAVLRPDRVVCDVRVVTWGDLKTVVLSDERRARSAPRSKATSIVAKRLRFPRGTEPERHALLLECARNASDLVYAEARIYRDLTGEDIDRFETA